MHTLSAGKPARKASSVRHTRAIQRDRSRHPQSRAAGRRGDGAADRVGLSGGTQHLGRVSAPGLARACADIAGDGGARACYGLAPAQRRGRARASGATGAGVLGPAPSSLPPSLGATLALLACRAVPPGFRAGAASPACRVATTSTTGADSHRLGTRPLQPRLGL